MGKQGLIQTVFMMVFLLMSAGVLAGGARHYSEGAVGWYWHDDGKGPDETPDKTENAVASSDPVAQLAVVREIIEQAKAKAVLYPTRENVGRYIEVQNELGEHAHQFERAWKAVLLIHPELDYSLKHPTNNQAKRVEQAQESMKEKAVMRVLANQGGLFFFYRSSCPYCVRFAPIVKDFADANGIAVVPITTDGVALPEFPGSVSDQGQAAAFHVKAEPALFAVNPYTHRAFPVAYGLISEADLKRRLLDIAARFGGT